MPYLIINDENGSRIVHIRAKKNFLGRSPHNTIPISGEGVEVTHCYLHTEEGRHSIQVFTPALNILVNGARRKESQLKHGDVVTLGRSASFKFMDAPPPGKLNSVLRSISRRAGASIAGLRTPFALIADILKQWVRRVISRKNMSPIVERRRKREFKQRVRSLLLSVPCWFSSVCIHALVFLILAAIVTTRPEVAKKFVFRADIDKDTSPPLVEEITPFGSATREDEPIVERPTLFNNLIPSDHNETDNNDDARMALGNLDDTIGTARGWFGLRNRGGRINAVLRGGGTWGSERAVDAGLDWLARHQDEEGSWSNYSARCEKESPCDTTFSDTDNLKNQHPNPSNLLQSCSTGLTGLSLLAFLSAGYTHQNGQYADVVSRGLEFLKGRLRSNGAFESFFLDYSYYHLYECALATLALSEAYAMTDDANLRRDAQRAAHYLSLKAGDAIDSTLRGAREMDTSVFGFVIMALKSAEQAGLDVPEGWWARATRWLQHVTLADGRAGYRRSTSTYSSYSMTAVATYCWQLVGRSRGDRLLDSGIQVLRSWSFPYGNSTVWTPRCLYSLFYSTLAFYHYGGREWTQWNENFRDRLVKEQRQDGCERGSWICHLGGKWQANRLYTTCLAVLSLEVYYRYLPLYRLDATASVRDDANETGAPLEDSLSSPAEDPCLTSEPIPKDSMFFGYDLYAKAIKKLVSSSDPGESEEAENNSCDALLALREFMNWVDTYPRDLQYERKEVEEWCVCLIREFSQLHLARGEPDVVMDNMHWFQDRFPESASLPEMLRLKGFALIAKAGKEEEVGNTEAAADLRREALGCFLNLTSEKDSAQDADFEIAADLMLSLAMYDAAIKMYQNVLANLEEDGKIQETQKKLLWCYLKANRPEEAMRMYAQIGDPELKKDIRPERVYEAMGDQLFLDKKDYESALAMYLRALEYQHANAAPDERDTGKRETTSDDGKKLVDPRTTLHLKTSECLMNLSRWKEAIPYLEQVLEKHPNAVNIRRYLAECYSQVGDYDSALRTWDDVRKLTHESTPEWWEAKYRTAEAYVKKGNRQAAVIIIENLRLLYPDLGGEEMSARFEELLK